ncbi:hypothetical protein HJFPF1_03184 [Paramyrothecium foliicola]|nr:hypothetical protein HJFPF1_03184 [Paramyrothecium foliicola]
MRRDNKLAQRLADHDDDDAAYFTYRPLSNLPTPPPSSRDSRASSATPDDGEPLRPMFLGPAIHLINLIPSSASLATASVSRVQAMLSRADLPLETVALAVCILDSLDAKFARKWRLSCPLRSGTLKLTSSNKRHTLPSTPLAPQFFHQQLQQQQQFHIDSVNPELIILTALVIAVKFLEDPQEATQYYCEVWGQGMWSHEQLNTTERCIMESLNYRIMPLCDEDCLTDAMVDMQLAAQQPYCDATRQPSPPESIPGDGAGFVPSHCRSKTMSSGKAMLGLAHTLTPVESPGADISCTATPVPTVPTANYFDDEALA